MAGEFPSDAQVYAAVDDFTAALGAVIAQKYASPDSSIVELVEGFWAPDASAALGELTQACRPALELDPGSFHALAEGLYQAVRLLDEGEPESGGFFEGFRAAPEQLAGWQGQAADAFRTQVSRIGKFAAEQSAGITKTAGCLVAAYQVTCLARTDLITVFARGADACRAMTATDETQAVQAQLYVGAALASGTLNYVVTAGALARALGAAAQAIGTGTAIQAASISGSTPQELLDSVRREQQGVVDRMHGAFADIVARTDRIPRSSGTGLVSRLFTPLPAFTDVHDPGFTYTDFSSPWQSSPAFGDAVRAEANPPPPPPAAGEVNTIRSALGG